MEDTKKYLYEEEIGLEEENIVIYSGEGTSDYEELVNKPSINGVLLMGDKTLDELGIKNGVTSYNELTDKPTIPTKTSELENDNGFITEIPSEYITEEKLNTKGYLIEYNESDPTVPQHVKNITTEDIEKWNNNTGGGSSFSGSWNDLTDRPAMYDDYKKTVLVDNIEFTTESNGERGYLFGIPNWTRGVLNGLEYEKKLYVVYDGKTYNAPYFQNPDYGNAFGNAFLFWEVIVGDGTGQNNTGEPFAIDTDGYFACYDTEPTQHTLSIYLKGEEIAPVKVPEKYIPIASTTTLGGVKIGNNLSIDENGVLSATGGSSAGGTTNYTDLTNKPQINGVALSGNKTLDELGIQAKGDYATKDEVSEAIANAIGKTLEGSY